MLATVNIAPTSVKSRASQLQCRGFGGRVFTVPMWRRRPDGLGIGCVEDQCGFPIHLLLEWAVGLGAIPCFALKSRIPMEQSNVLDLRSHVQSDRLAHAAAWWVDTWKLDSGVGGQVDSRHPPTPTTPTTRSKLSNMPTRSTRVSRQLQTHSSFQTTMQFVTAMPMRGNTDLSSKPFPCLDKKSLSG